LADRTVVVKAATPWVVAQRHDPPRLLETEGFLIGDLLPLVFILDSIAEECTR